MYKIFVYLNKRAFDHGFQYSFFQQLHDLWELCRIERKSLDFDKNISLVEVNADTHLHYNNSVHEKIKSGPLFRRE